MLKLRLHKGFSLWMDKMDRTDAALLSVPPDVEFGLKSQADVGSKNMSEDCIGEFLFDCYLCELMRE